MFTNHMDGLDQDAGLASMNMYANSMQKNLTRYYKEQTGRKIQSDNSEQSNSPYVLSAERNNSDPASWVRVNIFYQLKSHLVILL